MKIRFMFVSPLVVVRGDYTVVDENVDSSGPQQDSRQLTFRATGGFCSPG
jgi:hypothetical protein